jgi:hypothetical protein
VSGPERPIFAVLRMRSEDDQRRLRRLAAGQSPGSA